MKKHLFSFFMAFILVFGLTNSTKASLQDWGGGLIYDTVLDITWLQDANYWGSRTYWDEAKAWVENLSYYDSVRDVTYTDWRLPTRPVTGGSFNEGEMGHLYYDEGVTGSSPYPFINLEPSVYWSDTECPDDPLCAWSFSFNSGYWYTEPKESTRNYAWAVRDGTPIPIPGTLLVFGSGLIGLVAVRRRVFKK